MWEISVREGLGWGEEATGVLRMERKGVGEEEYHFNNWILSINEKS